MGHGSSEMILRQICQLEEPIDALLRPSLEISPLFSWLIVMVVHCSYRTLQKEDIDSVWEQILLSRKFRQGLDP